MSEYTINNSTVTQTTGFTPPGTLAGGDTLIIPSGWTNHLYFVNVVGASGNDIIITNPPDAKVNITEVMTASPYGSISFAGCRYILLDGSNYSSETYGIYLQNGKYGARLYETEDIKVQYTEVLDTDLAGIHSQKGLWNQTQDTENIILNNNYIHNTGTEGIYIGPSNFLPASQPSIKDCKIYSNIVEDTGWDGIQLCAADEGTNKIYDNYVKNAGHLGVNQHNNGIFICDYSIVEVYNNTVIDSYNDGIYIVWIDAVVDLHDNVFVRSGRYGINNNSNANGQKIINNTSVDSNYKAAGGYGIRTAAVDRGEIRYNLVVGTTTAGQISTSYSTVQNNLLSNSIPDQHFVDTVTDDYHLTSLSPAKDYSSNAGYSPTDFDGTTRPVGIKADAGAFEYIEGVAALGSIVGLTYPATVDHGAMCDINAAIKNIGTAAGIFKTQILIDSILLVTSPEFTLAGGATSSDKIDPFKAPPSGESMDIIIRCIRSE